jgi:alkyl hydroperoxide reductase subunit F
MVLFLRWKVQVIEILGDNFVNAIKIEKDKKEETLAVQGIFVEIGLIPNSDFAVDLNKTESGEIKVNNKNETNIPGIFAAGDVTDVFEKQIIIAAGEGAKATLSVYRYLSSRK